MSEALTPVPPGSPVGVVGAGTMGAGIALVAAQAGHPVRLLDARQGAAQTAVDGLRGKLAKLADRGKVDAGEATAAAARLTAVDGVGDLAGCALVVEAVVEDLAVKRTLFADLEEVLDASAVLATNTSSLSVTAVAAPLQHPGRIVGLHFFNPADRMRLVEVVRGDATDPEVLEAAVAVARAWGKTPVVCTSTPGFIVNRVARPYYGEAQRMVEEGVADPATIDAILREAGGFPLGPFELTDLVGQDVNLAVSKSVWEQTFHDPRYAPTVFQQRLVDAGRLGRKSGRGVFTYGDDGKATDAEPQTEPRREPPTRTVLRVDTDVEDSESYFETGFGVMTPFLDRIRGAVDVVTEPLDVEGYTGLRLPDGAVLTETYGRTATAMAREEPREPVILLDWAHEPTSCRRVALMPSSDCSQSDVHAAVGLCQAAGASVSVVGDTGGVVARTVSMIINEAVELVLRGEASAEDVDVAMVLGTSYPSGPFGWNDRLENAVPAVIERLAWAFPSGRYRTSLQFQRSDASERPVREL